MNLMNALGAEILRIPDARTIYTQTSADSKYIIGDPLWLDK